MLQIQMQRQKDQELTKVFLTKKTYLKKTY